MAFMPDREQVSLTSFLHTLKENNTHRLLVPLYHPILYPSVTVPRLASMLTSPFDVP